MVQLKQTFFIFTFIVTGFFFVGCASSTKLERISHKQVEPKNTRTSGNWMGEDTWICPVDADWDRKRFYLAGRGAEAGKEERDAIGLQKLARQTAETRAREEFVREAASLAVKEVLSSTDSRKIEELSKVLDQMAFTVPQMVTENYTPENDCRILFKFHAPGLKGEIVKLARKTFGK